MVGEIKRLTDALVVFDDMMKNVFTHRSHHQNVSVVFVVENFFDKNKHLRTIVLYKK